MAKTCMFWGNIVFHQFPSDQIWVWGGCGAAINCKRGGISDMFYRMNWCYKLHLEKHVIQLNILHLSKKIILNAESIFFKTFDMFNPFGNPLHLYYEMLSTTRFMFIITYLIYESSWVWTVEVLTMIHGTIYTIYIEVEQCI